MELGGMYDTGISVREAAYHVSTATTVGEIHPELVLEDDINQLLATHEGYCSMGPCGGGRSGSAFLDGWRRS
jgi:hypothetical protein